MKTAYLNNEIIEIKDIEFKTSDSYFCLTCGNEVVPRRRSGVYSLFQHKKKTECVDKRLLFEEYRCKLEISAKLEKKVDSVLLDYSFGDFEVDILYRYRGVTFAILIIKKRFNKPFMKKMLNTLRKEGIYSLWIHPVNIFLEKIDLKQKNAEFKLSASEHFIRTMFYGKYYLWEEGLNFLPGKRDYVKINKKATHVSSTFNKIHLLKDMVPHNKKQWNDYPAAKILNQRYSKA